MKFILDLEVLGLLWQIDTHLQTVCVGHSVGAESILWGSQIRQEITVAFGTGYGVVGEHDSTMTEMRPHQLERRKCKSRPNYKIVSSNVINEATLKNGLSYYQAEVGPPWVTRSAMSQADRRLSNRSRSARQTRIVPNTDGRSEPSQVLSPLR